MTDGPDAFSPGTRVDARRHEGVDGVTVENASTRLVVLPAIGAKVVSLVDRPTDRELLSRHPERPLRLPVYGDLYERYDIGGWDECFPTIGAVVYPEEPWRGVWAPDHGELWTLPWSWSAEDGGVRMWVDGVRFPYRFARTIRLIDGGLRIDYEVRNRAPFPFSALWSMHPMFAMTPTTRALLPVGCHVRVEYSKGDRCGSYLATQSWPHGRDHAGQAIDLGLAGPPTQGFADKLYTSELRRGAAALYDERTQDYVAFRFDPAIVPFVGVAMHRGGWPATGTPSFDAALEPCTGWPDRLDIAVSKGAAMRIPPHGSLAWWVCMYHGRGREQLDAIVGSGALH